MPTVKQYNSVLLAMFVLGSVALACHGAPQKGGRMSLTVSSEAFKAGAPIPKKFTEDGQDVSPPLSWQKVPEGTKELALICDDPDAPTAEPWVHWVLYKIPADVTHLPEGLPPDAELKSPAGARQGMNTWKTGRTVGYRGPAPPKGHGPHHYHFRLYALDAPLSLHAKATKQELLDAMKGNLLAEGVLIAIYERK
ncbi:MAG TPA: YbhB/YbcL family Raf kinase inhibitor-like protein [Pirellulales bacterium]|nr:YbhB/YbcL family Raf kinase inhibitor-like protein [Pirellulales bacterium]